MQMWANTSLWYCLSVCNSLGLPAAFLIDVLTVRTEEWSSKLLVWDYTLLRSPPPLYLEKDPALLDAEYLMSFFLYSYITEVIMGMRN